MRWQIALFHNLALLSGIAMRFREFHYHWEWHLESSPAALWPYVADTDRFNRATGVPALQQTGSTAKSIVNARRHLCLIRLGVPIEWEEEPFEWVRPHRFGVKRHYVSGPVAEMRVLVELTSRPNGGTKLVYQVWARPRNVLGLIAIPSQIGVLSAHSFADSFRKDDQLAASAACQHPPLLELSSRKHLEPGGQERLEKIRARLQSVGATAESVHRLIELVERSDDVTLSHIRPYFLADAWAVPRRSVLELCLHATRAGLLDMQWNLLCPLCRGSKLTVSALHEIEALVHCEVCHIDFAVNFDRSVELTFRPNQANRVIDARPYCVGGPQVTPHIVMQQLLPRHSHRSIALILDAGRYRVRALELRGGQFLSAEAGGNSANHLTIRASDEGWPTVESHVSLKPTLELVNDTEREQLVLLERMAWSDQAATAADVTTLQTFRDLFSSEVLRPGEQIAVGSLTVVFTDLRGSTNMYQQIGDAPAFGRVMDHYAVLRRAIENENGAIVKTIGDAVMAVFRRPISALRAMKTAQETLASNAMPLVLKVGMHYGPCIAVTLNDRLDYFGTTVNIAARIQHLSEGGDILISDAMRHEPEVSAWLDSEPQPLIGEPFVTNLKGIDGTTRLWRMTRVSERQAVV